jgi:hypothetical protein
MKSAVAGATTMAWASRASLMWSSARPASMRAVCTGRPVRASKVIGPTNSVAARVITTSTSAPSSARRRASHADL